MALFHTGVNAPIPNFNFLITLWDSFRADRGNAPSFLDSAATRGVSSALGAGVGVTLGGFAECTGLDATMTPETYQEGGANFAPRRFLGHGGHERLVLKTGVTFNPTLSTWYLQVLEGAARVVRKDGMVILFDRGGLTNAPPSQLGWVRTPIAAWVFRNGLPEVLRGPVLNATGNQIAIETLEIGHEGLRRVSAGMIPRVGDLLASSGVL